MISPIAAIGLLVKHSLAVSESAFSDDAIEAILAEGGATVPDDIRLVENDGAITIIQIRNGKPHGFFMTDDLAEAMVRYLKRRGVKVTTELP